MAQNAKHLVQVVSLMAVRVVRPAILCVLPAVAQLKKTASAAVKLNFLIYKQSSVPMSVLMVILVIWKQRTASLVLLGARSARTVQNVCPVDLVYCLLVTRVRHSVQLASTAANPTLVSLVMACARNACCLPVTVSSAKNTKCRVMENVSAFAQLEHSWYRIQRVVHPVIRPANHAQDPLLMIAPDVAPHLSWWTQDAWPPALQTTTLTRKPTVASHVTTTVQRAEEVKFIVSYFILYTVHFTVI